MFRQMRESTIERRDRERSLEKRQQHNSFVSAFEQAKKAHPEFGLTDPPEDKNSLFVQLDAPVGPKGYGPALTIGEGRWMYEEAF